MTADPRSAGPLEYLPGPCVLALNYEFPPIGGGGGNAHRHILREMTRYPDLQVTLITTTIKTEPVHESFAPNVRIHRLPQPKRDLLYWRRSEVLRYLLIHRAFLRQFLQNNHFDLCHVFFGFPSGWLAYWNRFHFPYLVSVRGSDVPGYNRRFSLDYIFLRPLFKRIYGSARRVVANSQGLKELFESQFPHLQAGVIPNGVDLEQFTPREAKGAQDANREMSIVTAARLIPRKGIDVLLRACARLAAANQPFQCHIIGDGPEEMPLRNLAAFLRITERVHFHGRMEKEQVAAFLPRCDIFVLPSYAEGMSNAALEAMACGLPLLLTDTGGSRELIAGNGAIIPPGDAGRLAEMLTQWLTHTGTVREMGIRSREHAYNFSWAGVAARYYDLYRQILDDNG
ncbi:MAG: glycosyltransferase [bacterium]